MERHIIEIIVLIVVFTAGFILGHYILGIPAPSGELIVDTSDKLKDRFLIELKEPTPKMAKRHIAVLKVTHKSIDETINSNRKGDPKWPNEI